jgi:hydroxymethylglutaryl-CoA synthase
MNAAITSFGAYLPQTRLSLSAIHGRGEKAVAGFDEDSVTMAVAAASDCLRGFDRSTVDGVMFASTTHPYREKSGASLIARALDLPRSIATADFAGSLRAGTSALVRAFDAVRAGSLKCVLVIASDVRVAEPRAPIERDLGDAAAAFLVSAAGEPIAVLESSSAITDEILDVWRADGDPFVKTWEDRFVTKHGVRDNLLDAVRALSRKIERSAASFDRAILYAPDARTHAQLARALEIGPERLVDPLFGKVGNAGCAFVPLMLASALETGRPGQKVLAASYGDGADAIALSIGGAAEKKGARRGVGGHLARKRVFEDYGSYLQMRDLVARENDPRGGTGISATVHFRDRDEDISLLAARCRRCGAMQLPAPRVCGRCFQKDDFDKVRLSDKTGKLLSFTFDHFHPSPAPPTIAGVVEIGASPDLCRVYLMLADASPKDVRLELPVELVFRKIHDAGGKPNYFWKAAPLS